MHKICINTGKDCSQGDKHLNKKILERKDLNKHSTDKKQRKQSTFPHD
jgi:hypothetical protein